MPYSRYPRRRTYRKKRNYKKKSLYTAKNAMTVANDAWYLSKKLARMVNVEYKHHDLAATSVLYPQAGVSAPVLVPIFSGANTIPQNDTNTGREGSSVKLQGLTIRLNSKVNSGAASPRQTVRIILFKWKPANGTVPSPYNIIDSNTATDLTLAPKDWDHRFQSKIMMDMVRVLSTDSTSEFTVTKHFKLFGHLQYSSGVSTIEHGDYYLMFLTDETSTARPNYSYNIRATYTDN